MPKHIKKLIKKYLIHLIIIFFIANTSIALLIFSKAASEPCMNQAQIDADNRCLYVYQNYVYEKGSRNNPHKNHKCGMNVDSIMPNLHFVGSVLTKFNNDKVAPFCTAVDPTSTPTQAPTQQPTQAPTQAPTQTPTRQPTQQATQQPTSQPTSQSTSKSTQTPTQSATQKPSITQPPKTNTPVPAQSKQTDTPTSQETTAVTPIYESYSGNTFGEILGKPAVKRSDISTQGPTLQDQKFDLTKISKPVSYASFISLIGSIILILLF